MLKPRSISKRNRYHPLSTKVVPVNLFAKSIQIPSQYLSPRSRRLHAVPWFTLDSTAITRLDHQEKRELNERNGETIKRNCPNVVDRGRGRGREEKGVRRNPLLTIHHVCGSQGRPSVGRAYVFHAARISEICSVARNIVGWPSTWWMVYVESVLWRPPTRSPVCTTTYTHTRGTSGAINATIES